MKKNVFFTFLLVVILKTHTQDYLISFVATGTSNTFDSIKVENLTQNKSKIVPGGNQLRLIVAATSINTMFDNINRPLNIYPNPAKEYSLIEFYLLKDGYTTLEIYDLNGKKVAQMLSNLEKGNHSYNVIGLGSGVFTIIVKTDYCLYTGKIISQSPINGNVQIRYIDKSEDIKNTSINKIKSTDTETIMQYTSGDRLMFKGISGIYSTIFTDIPVESKTITLTFINCTDADSNNYPVVEIGEQIWMAENLKTIKYSNGDSIPKIIDNTQWGNLTTGAYCDYDNMSIYCSTYGKLYNWYTVIDSNNICPAGWHIPNDNEWTKLIDYLGGDSIAGYKLKETGNIHWFSFPDPDNISTNESGFTALPGGQRYENGGYSYSGIIGWWWSSTESNEINAWDRITSCSNKGINRDQINKLSGLSVRCIRD